MVLADEIIHFFHNQRFVIVSTIDKDGTPHNACKGIIEIDKNGHIYLLDLYRASTYENLKRNHNISITGVDEHKFKGWCLKGKAKMIKPSKIKQRTIKAWEERITSRITHRIIKNMRGEKGHPHHPEAFLPKPEYMIAVEVKEAINLMRPLSASSKRQDI